MIQKTEVLTPSEIQIVQDFIYKTPNIIFYSKSELSKLCAIKIYINGELAGFCVLKDIGWSGRYAEIAVLGVLEKFQGRGFGKQLFELGLAKLDDKEIYCVSRNPKVIQMMKQSNFIGSNNTINLDPEINLDNLIYLLSFGRLREAIRKYFTFKNQPPFWYATKNKKTLCQKLLKKKSN